MNPRDIPKWDTSKKYYWEQDATVLAFFLNEYDKIRNGINLGGYYMTGWMYFHLNYFSTEVMDVKAKKSSVKQPPLDDNVYFLMECFKKATEESKGFAMWGTRGFAKSTLLASHEYWTHLVLGGRSGHTMIVYKEGNDLASIKNMFMMCASKIHPAFGLNVVSGAGDWSKITGDVVFGNTMQDNTVLSHSNIRLINAAGGAESASEKGAGLTPIGFKMDEIGKYDGRGIYLSAKISFKSQGIALFTPILAGTGGNETLSEGAKELLTNPNNYDISLMNWDTLGTIVPEEHITWKEDRGKVFSTFVPGQMSYRDQAPKLLSTFGHLTKGQFDNDEINKHPIFVTDWAGANKKFNDTLELLTTEKTRNKHKMALPRNIEDTFLTSGVKAFNKDRAKKRITEIKKDPKYTLIDVEVDPHTRKVSTTFSDKKVAEREYKGIAISAPIMSFEGFPDEIPVNYKFVSGVDDYKSEQSTTTSLGSIYIIKRREATEPLERIIASITERPERHRELHAKWEKIIRATNALCNLEIADASFVSYLEDTIKVNPRSYLHPFINPYQDLTKKDSYKKNINASGYRFGIYPTTQNKGLMIKLAIDYTETTFVADYDEYGTPIMKDGFDLIEDPFLLEEMAEYEDGGNYDRIVAFGWALVLARHMDTNNVKIEDLHLKKYNQNVERKPQKGAFSKSAQISNFRK